jgi:hypothetical protein
MIQETILQIRDLKSQGKKNVEIAKLVNLPISTITYWVDDETRKKRSTAAKNWFKGLSIERKREITKKSNAYRNDYIKRRYKEEEKFRESWKLRRRQHYAKKKLELKVEVKE